MSNSNEGFDQKIEAAKLRVPRVLEWLKITNDKCLLIEDETNNKTVIITSNSILKTGFLNEKTISNVSVSFVDEKPSEGLNLYLINPKKAVTIDNMSVVVKTNKIEEVAMYNLKSIVDKSFMMKSLSDLFNDQDAVITRSFKSKYKLVTSDPRNYI
jgi:hypothetical protein